MTDVVEAPIAHKNRCLLSHSPGYASVWCNCNLVLYDALGYGVGMPALLKLHEFGRIVKDAFDCYPLLVGSSLLAKNPRDIDVRLIVSQPFWWANFGSEDGFQAPFTRWSSYALAYSALGREMSGLPVDFQIQSVAIANRHWGPNYIILGISA